MNRYPFCLFRIPENGGRVLWEITNTCNYHCSYCIFSSESKKYENELSTEEIKKAIKELKENNFTYIKFTGGEPFTRDDMIEILKYARNLGFDMDISTNGSLITEKIAKELNVDPSYITKIIKKDARYEQEKEYRAQISRENRKIAKREWIRNKRQSETDKQLYEFVKQQHIEASKELSYSSEMSDLAYIK